jgi:tetratricopeptide (TPR) repeat protein
MSARSLLIAASLLATAACSSAAAGPATAEDAYRRGLSALEQGQPRIARVELLNAIKLAPTDGRIRLAQARTYLELGDGVAAQAELKRARALRVPVGETSHLMAHAYLLEGRPEQAIAEAGRAAAPHAAYAARIAGKAHQALGNDAEAAAAFSHALTATPDDPELWTDIARFRRSTGELAGAIEAADRALAIDARNVEALALRGELTRNQYGLVASIPWFDKALEIDPNHLPSLVERAATLADAGWTRAMLADTRRILSLAPGHATAYYLQAMLAARAGKFELARSIYGRTNGAFDAEPAGMLLAGAIDLETGNAERAVTRLARLVEIQPDNVKARRLLAAAQWRVGDSAATIATLRPLAERADADSYVLTLFARALAARGDSAAAAFLARAANPGIRATAPLGAPVTDAELAALRRDSAARPGQATAQVALIRALLGRGLGSEALEQARLLQSANPGAPDAHVLVGDSLGALGDYAAAAQAYRQAANIAFTEPVALRLVEALRNAGDQAGAARVLALFLQQNPQSVPATMLAANNYLQAGDWKRSIALYERLRSRLGDRDATLLNNLAWAYSQTGDYETALPLAARAWQLDRNNPATADTFGWLLFKSGEDPARGLALLKQAAEGAPTDEDIRRRLAAASRRG